MRKVSEFLFAAFLVTLFCAAATSRAGSNGAAAFEQLKSLVGHWQEATATDAQASMDIEMTGNGSAILERFHMIEKGKPVEMTTLYYLDGDQLKMTHYCMAGNQPRMRSRPGDVKDELVFEFAGGTNLDVAKDKHMHEATLTIVSDDRIEIKGTGWENGAPAKEMCCGLKLVRKK